MPLYHVQSEKRFYHALYDSMTFVAIMQANIKVQGSNGRNQMLKVWLPGLLQLVGDHAKLAVANDADINTLLDCQSGLKILPSED